MLTKVPSMLENHGAFILAERLTSSLPVKESSIEIGEVVRSLVFQVDELNRQCGRLLSMLGERYAAKRENLRRIVDAEIRGLRDAQERPWNAREADQMVTRAAAVAAVEAERALARAQASSDLEALEGLLARRSEARLSNAEVDVLERLKASLRAAS